MTSLKSLELPALAGRATVAKERRSTTTTVNGEHSEGERSLSEVGPSHPQQTEGKQRTAKDFDGVDTFPLTRDAQHKITYGARSVFESNARRGVATFVVAGKVRRIAGRDKAGDPGFVHLPFESTGYDFFLSGTFDVDDGGGAGRPGLPRVARDCTKWGDKKGETKNYNIQTKLIFFTYPW